jgi:hypothetical protein
MKVNLDLKNTKKVEVATLSISGKTRDLCFVGLYDEDGNKIKEHDGYVPEFIPGCGGDYIDCDIDINTGQILNWKVWKEELESFINGDED